MDDFDRLIEACMVGDIKTVSAFLERGVSINQKTVNEHSPLVVACYHEHFEIVKLLIENGADINAVNSKGTTVFMYAKTPAIKSGKTEIMDFLLNKGADINAIDKKEHKTVFDYVVSLNIPWMEQWLKEKGAKSSNEI